MLEQQVIDRLAQQIIPVPIKPLDQICNGPDLLPAQFQRQFDSEVLDPFVQLAIAAAEMVVHFALFEAMVGQVIETGVRKSSNSAELRTRCARAQARRTR